ncbi:MAG: hypothetical protein KUG79_20220 [Pseudomonadales bacterium]|nr:hypothetical protein [Pseudomonadales bacterium]
MFEKNNRWKLLTGSLLWLGYASGGFASEANDVLAAKGAVLNPGVTKNGVEANRPRASARTMRQIDLPTRAPMNAPVGSMQLELQRFEISGNTIFSDQSLHHLVGEFVDTRISFADLLRAANKITNYYRDAGYLVARAYIPEQEIQGGVVEISVLEGLVGSVAVNNDAPVSSGLVDRYLQRIKSGTVVSRKNVERTMLLLNDLPGVDATAKFKVGKTEGSTDLEVSLKKGRRISGSVDANNFGSEFTGKGRFSGTVVVNGLVKQGDSLGVTLLSSEDSDTVYGNIDYSMAVTGFGTRVGLRYSNLDSDVSDEFVALDLESEAETFGLYVTHPVVRSRHANMYLQANYESRDVKQIFGVDFSDLSTEDETDVITLAVSGDYRHSAFGGGVSSYGVAIQKGVTDTDQLETIRPAESKFLKADVSYRRLQYLPRDISLLLKFSGQFSEDALFASEQFSLGGPGRVRAFINGERLVDSGLVLTAEISGKLPLQNKYITSTRAYGFYDYGHGELNEISGDDNFDLDGIGIGIKIGMVGNYQVDLSYAHSLSGEAVADDDDGQFLIQAVKWFD